jgi:TM2 domain-containing membrane protein YozV
MEANFNNMEERLWNYIDGVSEAEEKTVIEQLLHDNAAWNAKYRELLEVGNLLQSSELEAPSMRFTKNVMEEIARFHISPATRTYINKKIIWGIGIFFITLIIGFIGYGFGQVDWTIKGNNSSYIDLSKIDYSRFFNNTYINAFMMINVVLGLFFLDRYLANKRKKFREGA